MKSKYLGMKFGDWKVVDAVNTNGSQHKIFTLERKSDTIIESFTVRDNELTKLCSGKTVVDTLYGKSYECKCNIRVDKNTVALYKRLLDILKNI